MNKLTIMLACGLLAAPASAQFIPQATAIPGSAPEGINYQGRLEDGGFPVNATKSMIFRVYSAPVGGVLLWTSPAQAVPVALGLFSAVVPVPTTVLVGGGARYLEVSIDSTLMAPRELLNSVPYALIAKSVEGNIDVSTAGLSINANSTAPQPALYISSVTGNVGIGTGAPITAFDVGGSAQFGSGTTKSTFSATGALNTAGKITAPDYTATYGIGAATASFSGSVRIIGELNGGAATTAGLFQLGAGPNGFDGARINLCGSANAACSGTGAAQYFTKGNATADHSWYSDQGGGTVEKMRLTAPGSLSVAQGITASSVTINGSALFRSNGFVATFSSGASPGQDIGHITYGVGATDSFDLYGRPGKSLSLGANGAPVAYIKGTSIGIGTALPSAKIHISTPAAIGPLGQSPGLFIDGDQNARGNIYIRTSLDAAGQQLAFEYTTGGKYKSLGFDHNYNAWTMMDFAAGLGVAATPEIILGGPAVGSRFGVPAVTYLNYPLPQAQVHISSGVAGRSLLIDGNATYQAIFNGTGSVGIGSVNPASKLHLSSGTMTIDGDTTLALSLPVLGQTIRGWNPGTGSLIELNNSGDGRAKWRNSYGFEFSPQSNKGLFIEQTTGRVGVHAANVAAGTLATDLEVDGTASFGSGADKSTFTTTGTLNLNSRLPGGQISIGGTDPSYNIYISSPISASINLHETTTGADLKMEANGGASLLGTIGGNPLIFKTSNTERLRIAGGTAITTGGALCLNASKEISKCTSAVDASGNCTCP